MLAVLPVFHGQRKSLLHTFERLYAGRDLPLEVDHHFYPNPIVEYMSRQTRPDFAFGTFCLLSRTHGSACCLQWVHGIGFLVRRASPIAPGEWWKDVEESLGVGSFVGDVGVPSRELVFRRARA